MPYQIRFLIDENVRNDVSEIFRKRGHEVILSRDVTASATPDHVIAPYGKYESLVIVSHDRDFRKYRKLLPDHERSRFTAGAGRLQLEIDYARSPQRVAEEIEAIEFHYAQAQIRHKPFLMVIMDANIKIQTL